MKQRGRKSVAELAVVKQQRNDYPPLPEDLTPDELDLWRSIVFDRTPDFFDTASLPLLREYVRLNTTVDEMAYEIEEFELDWVRDAEGIDIYRKMQDVRDRAQGRMLALARAMRLTQQARYVPHSKGSKPAGIGGKPKPWEKQN